MAEWHSAETATRRSREAAILRKVRWVMFFKNRYFDWKEVPVIIDLPMAAQIVGQTPETLQKRCQRGTFPGYKEGGEWRVEKNALFAHINKNSAMPEYSLPTESLEIGGEPACTEPAQTAAATMTQASDAHAVT